MKFQCEASVTKSISCFNIQEYFENCEKNTYIEKSHVLQ